MKRQNDSSWWIWCVEQKECDGEELNFDEASVEMMGVSVKGCQYYGIMGCVCRMVYLSKQHNVSSVRTERVGCLFFYHNGNDGVYMYADGVVGYTGGTSWRTNGDSPQQRRRPSLLWFMTMKTMILDTSDSGKIQSQLSSSSLELTVIHPIHVHVAAPDDDEEEDN